MEIFHRVVWGNKGKQLLFQLSREDKEWRRDPSFVLFCFSICVFSTEEKYLGHGFVTGP